MRLVQKKLRIDHRAKPLANQGTGLREELIGYGKNNLRIHNIPVSGGAITVNGVNIEPTSQVTVMGQHVPVAANGRFAFRQILPAGHHVVAVQVVNQAGELNFLRNLYIPNQDWFYIGIIDLIAGENRTSGPAQLMTGNAHHYDNDFYLDGRLAFYLKGKIKGEWLLTAAADTREQPLGSLFSNFDSKDPRYLLRRLDPNRFYPVYGDDSTAVDDAPTAVNSMLSWLEAVPISCGAISRPAGPVLILPTSIAACMEPISIGKHRPRPFTAKKEPR